MYVPMTLAQPASALAPAPLVASAQDTTRALQSTAIRLGRAQLAVLAHGDASVEGRLLGRARRPLAHEIVVLQRRDARTWRTLQRSFTGAHGRFRFTLATRSSATGALRVAFAGDGSYLPSHRRLGRLRTFRVAEASWYGGGGSLACGGELTSATLGVASRTLPCGMVVTLRYGGRSISVPVIDRGPYVEGREFDLTEATKQALGFGDTGQLWVST